jgi:hypothetical protein
LLVVKITPTPVTLAPGGRQYFNAAVTGVPNPAVTWSIEENDGGVLSSVAGESALYTAPNTGKGGTYHVIATSIANPAITAVATITVTPVVVKINPATVLLSLLGKQEFTAALSPASVKQAVTWKIEENGGGALSSATSISVLYTAPSTAGIYHLIATSVAFPAITAIATITAHLGPAPVNLGTAADFAILAGSTVTSTGFTVVNGNLGLSPGTAVSGFPPGRVVNGAILVAPNPTVATAKLNLTTAYNDAAGRALNVVNIPTGELGGLTLGPGLYRSGISSFRITAVNLTLDAKGDKNAVWIFQMPSSTLTVGNGQKVILAGGAQAGNIYWQVGSSATLGTTCVVEGNILASASISLKTGATLNGRALTQIAAVTLEDNSVTMP